MKKNLDKLDKLMKFKQYIKDLGLSDKLKITIEDFDFATAFDVDADYYYEISYFDKEGLKGIILKEDEVIEWIKEEYEEHAINYDRDLKFKDIEKTKLEDLDNDLFGKDIR